VKAGSIGSNIIFHPILFAIFPILSVFSYNVRELSFQETFLPLFLVLTFTVGIWISLRYILKNARKSAFIISLLLVLFFSFGHVYNLVDDVTIDGFDIGKSRYLLIPFLISLVVGVYYFIKTNRKLNNATTITNFITITLILIVSVNIGTFYIANDENFSDDKTIVNSFFSMTDSEPIFTQPDKSGSPDVYYIILDGYAGTNSLKEFLGFDNQKFVTFLSDRGFYVHPQSYSNYPTTPTSMAATLNMQYVNKLADIVGSDLDDMHPTFEIIQENLVMKYFKSKGYTLIGYNAGILHLDETKKFDFYYCEDDTLLDNKVINSILHQSIIGYFAEKVRYQEYRDGILCAFSELPEIKNIDEPTFLYAHFNMPHAPYIFSANGEPLDPARQSNLGSSGNVNDYINYLKFTNMKMQKLVEHLLETDDPPIIIIQSDHGSGFNLDWENPTDDMLREKMSNFQAFYLPNGHSSLMSEATTPVNIFRVLFNSHFNENHEILTDKIFWVLWNKPYDFKDITNVLNVEN
jgi:hypothetical protein